MESNIKRDYIKIINDFLYTPAYFFFVGILTVFANVCGAEFFTYTCFVVIVIFICFFGRDFLPIMPLAVCCYIAPSRSNNPGVNSNSMFSLDGGGAFLLVLVVVLIIGFVYRLATDKTFGGKAFFSCKRKLLSGMLTLGVAYLLSGIGSKNYTENFSGNLLFAFIQFASIIVFYYFITATVDWTKAPKAYLAWTGVCVGYVLIAELVYVYLTCGVIDAGVINRDNIFTGWGHYNNMGALLVVVLPFTFYLTGKGRHAWIFYLTALFFLGGIFFTCSRSSILVGTITYVVSYIISLINSRQKRANLAIHIITVVLAVVVLLLFADKIVHIFQALLDRSLDPGHRYDGYKAGFKQFLDYPIFGGSFFPVDYKELYSWSTSEAFVSFFPPRWHNTILQMLASCGVVGMLAYAFHRVQTFALFLRKPSCKKMFAFVSILALLCMSLLDCHFFNVGPTMFYSLMLAFVEKKQLED